MRKYWVIAIALWAGLMLLGWGVWAAHIEGSLELLARKALRTHEEARQLKGVVVEFDGQRAVLKGKVNKGAMRGLAEHIIREELREPAPLGGELNPVASVQNEIEIESLPPGWLVLIVTSERADLVGVTSSNDELEELAQAVKKRCDKPGRQFHATLRVDDEKFGSVGDHETTLTDLERQMATTDPNGAALTAQIGSTWSTIPLFDLTEMKVSLTRIGVSEIEWVQSILPFAKLASEAWESKRREETDAARLAKLPPPHLFLAFKDENILLRGIVGTARLKTQIIEAALQAYPEKRVIDQISISTNRRPILNASNILNFPVAPVSSETRQIAFAVPESGWKAADSALSDYAAAAASLIPKGMEPTLIEADQAEVVRWISVTEDMQVASMKPYLTLALFGSRVWLRGQVAEESTRTQIVEAVRRAYPNHLLVQFIRLNSRCLPADGPLQTALSLPPSPDPSAPGILAFAVPGEVWHVTEVSPALLEPNGVSRSGIVPAGPIFQIAAEDFSEALDALRGHQQQIPQTKPK